jgi:hypothetical protein
MATKRHETHPISESLKDFAVLTLLIGGITILGVGIEAL